MNPGNYDDMAYLAHETSNVSEWMLQASCNIPCKQSWVSRCVLEHRSILSVVQQLGKAW